MTIGILPDNDIDSGSFEAPKIVKLDGPGCSLALKAESVVVASGCGGNDRAMKAGSKRDIVVSEAIRRRVFVGMDTVAGHVGELVGAAKQGDMVVRGCIDVGSNFQAGGMGARYDERHKDRIKASPKGWVGVALGGIALRLVKEDFDEVRFCC